MRRSTFIFLLLFLGMGCTYFKSPSSPPLPSALPLLLEATDVERVPLNTRQLTARFYRDRQYTLAWHDSSGRTASADLMINMVRSAEAYGLSPADYHLREIEELIAQPVSHTRAVDIDLYLTDAFFTMRYHLGHGVIDPLTLQRRDLAQLADIMAITDLNEALSSGVMREPLTRQEPVHREYNLLKATLTALVRENRTDSTSLARSLQLKLNLERWRWQGTLPDRYIAVNAPSAMLRIREKDSVVMQSKVIVGKPETATPELKSVVKSFIIYPYWHVPKSIVDEILPHIQEDTVYLKKHNYDVLDGSGKTVKPSAIDWEAYDAETFPYILRQREGSENTMGVIKFVFANRYGVYLHDTNARRLFAKEERALSHGCVRVHKAVELARYLIKDDYIVSPEDLDQYLQLQRRMDVRLPSPIPLYLTYFTCESEHGVIRFYPDLYGKDAALIQALHSGSSLNF